MKRILIESGIVAGSREIMEGITFYVRERPVPWQLYPVGPEEFLTALKSRPDAALTMLTPGNLPRIAAVRRAGIPTVNMLRNLHPRLPSVSSDHHAIGHAAADYFLSRGFENFAFFGTNREWSDGRLAGFRARLRQSPKALLHIENSLPNEEFRRVGNPRVAARLARWLPTLPQPLALFAASDYILRPVLDACKILRLLVPDRISLLGVDNDPAICELGPIPLSSIPQNFMRIGFESAKILDGLLSRRRPYRSPLFIPPRDIVLRRSTDFIAAANPHVAAALRHIHALHPRIASVKALLVHLPISRQWLDHQFKQTLGHSAGEEIRRAKLTRAKSLLQQTHLPIHEIAARCGFAHPENFTRFIHDHVGQSPRQLRSRHPFTSG